MLGRGWPSASLCVDVFALGDVSVGEECEAAILNNANPPACASKLLDYAHRDFHGVVGDIVFADRVHALDGEALVFVGAHQHFRSDRRQDNWVCIKALLTASADFL